MTSTLYAEEVKIAMRQEKLRVLPTAVLFLLMFLPSLQAATGYKAMVVTSDARATQAALEILRKGGNAVDAAVAAQWVMSVVAPQSCGLGGSGSLLFYESGTRRILFYDGSVKAPAEASPGMFFDAEGQVLPYAARSTGALSSGVPGLLRLAEEAHAKYGTRQFEFEKLWDPAIRLAEEGAEVSGALAKAIRENAERLAFLDPEKSVFFKNGIPLHEGEKCLQPELAGTFRLIQKKGAAVFYDGILAEAMAQAVSHSKASSGLFSKKDLEDYDVARREPVHATYLGYDLFSAAPPCDGGVMLFRGLNVISHFGIPGFGQVAETYHLLAETQKTAFSNRTGIADPDLFEVPLAELLSEAWAQERAGKIQFDQVLRSRQAGKVLAGDHEKRSGSSIIVVDPRGNIAILSATLGDPFGGALRVPGYGFFMNDLLASFAADPAAVRDPLSAELISGGQRPRVTDAPVFVFKDGKPVLLLNAYGPDDPAAILLNLMVQTIDLGASCHGAVTLPRLLAKEGVLWMEPGLYGQEMIRLKLDLLGHKTEKKADLGMAQMVCFEGASGRIDGESDPRADGEAAGF